MMYQGTALIRLILLGGVITWIRYPYKLPVEEVYMCGRRGCPRGDCFNMSLQIQQGNEVDKTVFVALVIGGTENTLVEDLRCSTSESRAGRIR